MVHDIGGISVCRSVTVLLFLLDSMLVLKSFFQLARECEETKGTQA